MWSLREIARTTVVYFRRHWLFILCVGFMTIYNGVDMIITDRGLGTKGGGALARFPGDSLRGGICAITLGVVFLGLKWLFVHLKRWEDGEMRRD